MFPNYQSNTDIFFSILLLQPNKLSIDHQTNSVFVNDDFEEKIDLAKLNCSIFFSLYCLIVSKKINDFLREIVRGKICFDGSMSIHLLSCIGMVAVVPASTLGCGFAFAFDLAATTLMLVCGTCSSCGSIGISCRQGLSLSQVLCANIYHRSLCERDVFPLATKTRSVSSGFPDRSQIGLNRKNS